MWINATYIYLLQLWYYKTIAFDINHPFGFCWGNGSTYQVTPDIQARDQVVMRMDGVQVSSSTVLPVIITQKSLSGHTITLTGTGVSSLSNPTFMECRIIQPALVNTSWCTCYSWW